MRSTTRTHLGCTGGAVAIMQCLCHYHIMLPKERTNGRSCKYDRHECCAFEHQAKHESCPFDRVDWLGKIPIAVPSRSVEHEDKSISLHSATTLLATWSRSWLTPSETQRPTTMQAVLQMLVVCVQRNQPHKSEPLVTAAHSFVG